MKTLRPLIPLMLLIGAQAIGADFTYRPLNSGRAYLLDNNNKVWPAAVGYTTDGNGNPLTIEGASLVADNLSYPLNSGKALLTDNASHLWPAMVLYTTDGSGNVIPITASGGGGSGVTTMSAFGSSPNVNGASISTTNLTLQPADATHPGGVSTGAQSFGGPKTLTSPILITPALGTPASGVATNLTGTAAGLTAGNVTTNANLTGPITSVGNATSLASSTGSGAIVLATNATLVNPALGTPASGVATNLTGTASGLTAGNVTTNANLTGDVTSSGNATTLTNAPVIAKVLTGYSSGAGTVGSGDSILQAFQKINGNDALKAPLASPTFTGAVTLPNGAIGTPALVSGRAATDGVYFGASGNIDMGFAGANPVEFGANYINVGTSKGSSGGLSSSSSINFTNINGAALSASVGLLNYATSAQEFYESIASKIFFADIKDGQGSMCFQSNSSGAVVCGYLPYEFISFSSDTAYNTASSTGMYKTFVGSNDTNAVITTRNAFNGAGTFGGISNADSTLIGTTNQGPFINGSALWYNDTQNTTGSNGVSHYAIATTTAGVRAEKWFLSAKGQMYHAGTAPVASSCGTSAGTATGADNSFSEVVGSSGTLTGCVFTLATAWPNGGDCHCTDQTSSSSFTLEAVLSSTNVVTVTPYAKATGLATSFNASDNISCSCSFH